MGHKVNPNGFRYGISKEHQANWYADKKHFADFLLEDSKIRKYFEKFIRKFMIGKIDITRDEGSKNITITIQSARPGAILGQNGEDLKTLTKNLKKTIKNRKSELNINIVTIEKPELNARLVAEQIAMQLENRGSFRAAQKTAIRNTMKAGAKGIKTSVSGRLNGADMARSEGYTEGTMSLHTLRQDIEFATATARTTYGAIGIKVWISKGEILDNGKAMKEGDE